MARPEVTSKKEPIRLLSRTEVAELLGVSYVCIWQWMRAGKFPLGRSIGGYGPHGRVFWIASEIEDWIQSRPKRIPKGFKGKIKEPALSD